MKFNFRWGSATDPTPMEAAYSSCWIPSWIVGKERGWKKEEKGKLENNKENGGREMLQKFAWKGWLW